MVDVFVERHGASDQSGRGEPDAVPVACCDLHKAHWQGSYVAEAGPRICHYRAPDAESVRLAFRATGIRVDAIWTGTVHGSISPSADYAVVSLRFEPPLPVDAVGAVAIAQAEWLTPVGLRLAQAFVSTTHGRVICLCERPDGDSYRLTPSGNAPGEGRVWSCRSITVAS